MDSIVDHKVEIGGLIYRIARKEDYVSVIDAFFDYMIEGKSRKKKLFCGSHGSANFTAAIDLTVIG